MSYNQESICPHNSCYFRLLVFVLKDLRNKNQRDRKLKHEGLASLPGMTGVGGGEAGEKKYPYPWFP